MTRLRSLHHRLQRCPRLRLHLRLGTFVASFLFTLNIFCVFGFTKLVVYDRRKLCNVAHDTSTNYLKLGSCGWLYYSHLSLVFIL